MCKSYISCLGGVNYLGHFLPVCLGIQWSFRQENGMFFGSNAELIVESVMPDLWNEQLKINLQECEV